MRTLRSVLTLTLIGTAACARARFDTHYALAPHLTAAVPGEAEEDRRERERRQEVALLRTERTVLTDRLHQLYELDIAKPSDGWFAKALNWRDYDAADRNDIARALIRIVELSSRKNLLTGRADSADQTLTRARNVLNALSTWTPKREIFYGK